MRMRTILTTAFLSVALMAAATTVGDLETRAGALHAAYVDLDARVDACPGGTCSGASAILADRAALENDRAALHADRATVNPCTTCSPLDATMSAIDGIAADVTDRVEEWEQSS